MPNQKTAAPKKNAGLRVIATLKIAKGLLLTGLGLGLFRAINHDLGETARNIAQHLRLDPENHMLQLVLEKVTDIEPKTLKTFGLISLLYAAELYLEGIGLWLNQAWAKYLVVVATSVFVPEEIYSLLQRPTSVKFGLLVLNLAVLGYVIWTLWPKKKPAQKTA